MNTQKIALITGGSRGLGRDMALKLVEKGLGVVFTYNSNKQAADSTLNDLIAKGGKAVALPLDVRDVKSFEAFKIKLKEQLETHWNTSNFDYLVNNAGFGHNGMVTDTSEEAFDDLMNVHFKGVYFLTQTMLPMVNDEGGIINLSSGLARFSLPGYSAYAAMKGAIEVYTRS